jgi:Na+-driven multidrug efflux pump
VAVFFFLLSQFIHLIYPNISIETSADLKAIAPLYILLPIIRGYNSVSGNILRALGDSNRILKLHLITQWMIALPLCEVLVLYYQVSIFWAFAVMLIEEVIKSYHFYQYTQEKLSQTNGVAY